MTLTQYFIKHPIVAVVLNAMIILVGYLSMQTLTLREYPEVSFPEVFILTKYPNASAEVVETSISNPLEDNLAGIDGLETLTSYSQFGQSTINLKFKNDTSLDQIFIAIREAIGITDLPETAQAPFAQRASDMDGLPFIGLALETSSRDFGAITHYALSHLQNIFRSIKGVAGAQVWGQPYTYKISLDPRKMYAFGVNVDEVYNALKEGNMTLPGGKFQNEISVTLNSELKTVADFENLVIRNQDFSMPDSKIHTVLLKQIATTTQETSNKRFRVRVNGQPGLAIAIKKANDANPLDVSTAVRQQVEDLASSMPKDTKLSIVLDQAEFVRHALKNVKSSIYEAMFFVLLIVFLFLRNIKATIIPLITIPISLMGSFILLKAFGFSINIMTLLAMVLAIGLVVDDAIIVLENIQRHIETGLTPMKAALLGSKEIAFAILAMTLTLTSVYAPLAFISGNIGDIFVEFAVALAGSVLVSGVVALTLTPVMCSKTLSAHKSTFFSQFDTFLDALIKRYQTILGPLLSRRKTGFVVVTLCLGAIVGLMKILPTETAPKEDRSLIGVYTPPLVGKDINTLETKILAIEEAIKNTPEKNAILTFMGDWGANAVLPLKAQSERKRSAVEILNALRPIVSQFPSIDVHPWSTDTGLPGVDMVIGQGELSLILSSNKDFSDLYRVVDQIKKAMDKKGIFQGVRHDLKLDTPKYRIDLKTNEMAALNIKTAQVAKTVSVFFSGDQSLNFSMDGLLYPITLEGKTSPWSLDELYITTKSGKRVSLGAIAELVATAGPAKLYHHNQMRSVTLSADVPAGMDFKEAMKLFLADVNKDLPPTYKKLWTGTAKVMLENQTTMVMLFALAILFIFAIMSVQFESFLDPLIILITVPLACLGGLIFVWMTGGSLNIYTQVGLITLIGLITKHGILIVEFANHQRETLPLQEAIIKAAALRLRPILMTTGAMLFGAIPLILSSDAGHEAQRAIGIVLFGGLLLGTLFTLFVLPMVCFSLQSRSTR